MNGWIVLEVGPQRVVGEPGPPQPPCEFDDARGGVLADPLQHVDEVGLRVEAVQRAGDQQALDHADAGRSWMLDSVRATR